MPNTDFTYLADRFPHLIEWRLKGTQRPWREPISRWLPPGDETTPVSSGEAPLHLSTLQLIEAVRAGAAEYGVGHGIPARTATESILRALGREVDQEPPAGSYGRQAAGWAADASQRVRAHLGEVTDGQRLKAVCPWCWYQTMTIRVLNLRNGSEPFVRCESGVCAPPAQEVGSWWEGLPCWPMADWEWLAGKLDQAFEAA